MEHEKAARFTNGINTATTALRVFNIYDSSIFTTLFYSEVEKIWLLIVKNGSVGVDSNETARSVILSYECQLKYETTTVRMTNLLGGVGLSQVLVEKFLALHNCHLSHSEVAELASRYGNQSTVLECLSRNKLFLRKNDSWKLDYAAYIRFLERESDPIVDSVMFEFSQNALSHGISRTFSLQSIWNNLAFLGSEPTLSGSFEFGASNGIRTISNWPHSRRYSQNTIDELCAATPSYEKARESESSVVIPGYDFGECDMDWKKNPNADDESDCDKRLDIHNPVIQPITTLKRKCEEKKTKRIKFRLEISYEPVVHKLPPFCESGDLKVFYESVKGPALRTGGRARSVSSVEPGYTIQQGGKNDILYRNK